MGKWLSRVKIRHLFTEDETPEAIRKSMRQIADVLENSDSFLTFRMKSKFRAIPEGDSVIRPVDYANKLLDMMYDYADEHRIWIE